MVQIMFRNALQSDAVDFLELQRCYEPQHRVGKGAPDPEAIAKIQASLEKNGHYVFCADLDGRVVGAATVFPVWEFQVKQVSLGIEPDDILVPTPGADSLYICGINIHLEFRVNRTVLTGLLSYLGEEIGQMAPIAVYAQPATKEGQRMLDKFGFTKLPGDVLDDPIHVAHAESLAAVRLRVGHALMVDREVLVAA